jgi:hypothetical protein
MTCHSSSDMGHRYIIVVVYYFTKWEKAMMIFANNGEIVVHFMFNHIIARFKTPKEIFTNHGSHFYNFMVLELGSKLGFR